MPETSSPSLQRTGIHLPSLLFWPALWVTLRAPEERYELALIGKDINHEIVGAFGSIPSFQTGVGCFPGTIAGGTVRAPGGVDKNRGNSDPGREIWLRLTYRSRGQSADRPGAL